MVKVVKRRLWMIAVTSAVSALMIAGLCCFNGDDKHESLESCKSFDPNSLNLGADAVLELTELQRMKELALRDSEAAARVYKHYTALNDEREANTWLMICLGQGSQLFLDSTELQRMQMLAEGGDGDAAYVVSMHYGIAIRDIRESDVWLKKAAALGHPSAMKAVEAMTNQDR